MNLLIIEDEALAVDRIVKLLKDIDASIEVLGSTPSVEESILWLRSHPRPELIIMDISLADGTCFDILSQYPIQSPVIFITAYDQFAIDAFKVFSIDYLLKPVSKTALEKSILKLRSIQKDFSPLPNYQNLIGLMEDSLKEYKSRFLIKAWKRMFFKELNDISYFTADDKTIFLVGLDGGKWIIDYSLDKLEKILDPKIFFRINRKIICRIGSIKEIRTYPNSRLKITLQAGNNKEETIISRERVQSFKIWAEQ